MTRVILGWMACQKTGRDRGYLSLQFMLAYTVEPRIPVGCRSAMVVIFISCFGLSLEAILVAGGLRTKLVQRFPLFYSYILFVFVQDVLRSIVHRWYSELYPNIYWVTQFVALVLGSAVVFEICRLGLREFPGTAKMARNLLGVAFLAIIARWLLTLSTDSPAWPSDAYVNLERDLRTVQSVGLVILLLLFVWYAIPLGRNLGGILLGYGTFVAMSVAQLSIVSHYGDRADRFWVIAQPATYALVLGIWTVALWAADPVTIRVRTDKSDRDYEGLAGATAASLKKARGRLQTAVRP